MGLLAASAAVVVYATFAVALQAATSKVQNEMRGIGYVYTFYAVTSCALALGIAALVRALIHNERLRPQRFFVMAFGIAFVFVQFTINWNISASMNEVQVRNRRLTASFDSDAPMAQRCDALVQWAQGEWPLYYEQGMTDGLQVAYPYYFGEPFCSGYTPSG
jgi:hypothetical protein